MEFTFDMQTLWAKLKLPYMNQFDKKVH